MTSRVPAPTIPEDKNDLQQPVVFSQEYLRMKGSMSWSKCSPKDQQKICDKIKYWEQRSWHEFRTGSAKPRKWRGKLPSPPKDLSQEIKDNLADYFNIDPKIRLFGYIHGNTFFLIWVTTNHKHSK